MAEVVGADDRTALAAVEDLPVLGAADLDADPRNVPQVSCRLSLCQA